MFLSVFQYCDIYWPKMWISFIVIIKWSNCYCFPADTIQFYTSRRKSNWPDGPLDTGKESPSVQNLKWFSAGVPALLSHLDSPQKDKQGKACAIFHKNEHLNHMHYIQFPGGWWRSNVCSLKHTTTPSFVVLSAWIPTTSAPLPAFHCLDFSSFTTVGKATWEKNYKRNELQRKNKALPCGRYKSGTEASLTVKMLCKSQLTQQYAGKRRKKNTERTN